MYVLYHLPVRGKFLRPCIRKVDVIEIISDQMKKEVFLNINQLIWTTLHRLVRGTIQCWFNTCAFCIAL